MTDLRTAAQQALEALKYLHEEKCDYMRRNNLGDPLREDAARLALPAIEALEVTLAQLAEPVPVVDRCANCLRPKGEHQGDMCPRPYTTVWHAWDYEAKRAQPVQEPVALAWSNLEGTKFVGNGEKWKHKDCVLPLYAAPPQRKPLSEEELKACLPPDAVRVPSGWLNFARAVEAAHGIKEGT